MAKSNPEIPAFPMLRVHGGFTHNTPWVDEMLSQYAIGAEVEIKVMQRRSLPQLQLYWVVLHDCVENSDSKYGRAEDLHDALKIALGYTRRVKVVSGDTPGMILLRSARFCLRHLASLAGVCEWVGKMGRILDQLEEHVGDTIVLPGSIAFGRMTQADFKIYFDKAMNELRAAGYEIDAFLEEGEKKLARFRAANPYQKGVSSHGRIKAAEPPGEDRGKEKDSEDQAAA